MADINIKKLFVKVDLTKEGVSQAWANAEKDPSKIYFLSNGSIYAAGRTYGINDDALDAINKAIKDEIKRAGDAETALSYRLNVIEGEGEGSIKKAIADVVGGASEAFDTLKEIEAWINKDGAESVQDFLSHVAEFTQHVKDFEDKSADLEEEIETAKNASAKALSDFIGQTTTDEAGKEIYNTTFPKQIFEQGPGVDDVEATNLKEYFVAQANFDAEQNARIGANADAITVEVTRAKAADEANADAITTEVTRAKGAEATNAKDISDEAARATTAENNIYKMASEAHNQTKIICETHNNNVTSLIGKSTDNSPEVTDSTVVKAETAKVTWSGSEEDGWKAQVGTTTEDQETVWSAINGVKKSLASKNEELTEVIKAEVTRAKAAEKDNADAITAEVTRAKAADEANANAITTEVTRAKGAEEALDIRVSAIETALEDESTFWEEFTAASGTGNDPEVTD